MIINISLTIGFRGTLFSDKPIYVCDNESGDLTFKVLVIKDANEEQPMASTMKSRVFPHGLATSKKKDGMQDD